MAHHPTKRKTSYTYFYPDTFSDTFNDDILTNINTHRIHTFLKRHQFLAVMAIVLSGLVITFLLQLLSINQQVYVKAVYGDVTLNSSTLAIRESEQFKQGDTLYVSPDSLAMIILPDNSVQLIEDTRIDLLNVTTKSHEARFEIYDHSDQEVSTIVSHKDTSSVVSVVTGIIAPSESANNGSVLGTSERDVESVSSYHDARYTETENHNTENITTQDQLRQCITKHKFADYNTLTMLCGL